MNPVDQTILHDPESGRFGNCYSACLASLLERPIEEFDLFHELYTAWGAKYESGQTVSFAERMAPMWHLAGKFGVLLVAVDVTHLGQFRPAGFSIANGPSERGVDHSCVAFDGVIVHDPHPSRAELVEIQSYESVLNVALGEG